MSSFFIEKKHSHHQFLSAGSTSTRPKYTTRHLAALDFLMNIPMANEGNIRQKGIADANRLKAMDDNNEGTPNDVERFDGVMDSMNTQGPDDYSGAQGELAGKKLKGPSACTVRFPMQFRYYMQRISEQSVMIRQWEDQLLSSNIMPAAPMAAASPATAVLNSTTQPPLLSSRMFFTRERSYPMMVFSVIKYDAGEEKAKIQKIKADDQKGLEVFNLPSRDWRGFSYKPLFKPLVLMTEEQQTQPQSQRNVSLSQACVPEIISSYYLEKGYMYDPDSLDDPEMLHGSHRYVLQRSMFTGPVISSIILYVNEHELKDSLNDQFRERHPQLPPSLTLSRIRNVKKKILVFCLSVGYEVSTVAYAVIYFERLCLRSFVTKSNRKLAMALSLVLAIKFNENEQSDKYDKMYDQLMVFFDREWDLARKVVADAEFGAYVHLGFALHVPYPHVYLVVSRLLKLVNKSCKQYIGDQMNDLYVQDILVIERDKELNARRKEEEEAALQAKHALEASQFKESTDDNASTLLSLVSDTAALEAVNKVTRAATEPSKPFSIGRLNFFADKEDHGRKRSGTVTIDPNPLIIPPSDNGSISRQDSLVASNHGEGLDSPCLSVNAADSLSTKSKSFNVAAGLKTVKKSLTQKLLRIPTRFSILGIAGGASQNSCPDSSNNEEGDNLLVDNNNDLEAEETATICDEAIEDEESMSFDIDTDKSFTIDHSHQNFEHSTTDSRGVFRGSTV